MRPAMCIENLQKIFTLCFVKKLFEVTFDAKIIKYNNNCSYNHAAKFKR